MDSRYGRLYVRGIRQVQNCDADVSDIATVTYAVKNAPTCLNAGTGTYTATFSAAYGFPAQTKDVLLPAIGHTWGTATYTWTQTETGYTCTAKRVCKNDSAHVENETVTAAYTVVTEPTCLTAGLGRYQVSFLKSRLGKGRIQRRVHPRPRP